MRRDNVELELGRTGAVVDLDMCDMQNINLEVVDHDQRRLAGSWGKLQRIIIFG